MHTPGTTPESPRDPLHLQFHPVTWNLDEYVSSAGLQDGPENESLPAWMCALTEPQANRIYQAAIGNEHGAEETIIRDLRDAKLPGDIRKDPAALFRIATQLLHSEGARSKLALWIRQFNDDAKDNPGKIIREPNIVRCRLERDLVKPAIQTIVREYFCGRTDTSNRVLIDLGARDGEITSCLHDDFGQLIAIEKDENLANKLTARSMRFNKIEPTELDVVEMLRGDADIDADMFLMYQTMHVFSRTGYDSDLLKWMRKRLRGNGLIMMVQDDPLPLAGSKTDVRRRFGAQDSRPDMRGYADWLAANGMGSRLFHPELRITASEPDGLTALADVVRTFVPGDVTDKREEMIRRYVESLRGDNGTATFRYRLAILASGGSMPMIPDDWKNPDEPAMRKAPVTSAADATAAAVKTVVTTPPETTAEMPWPDLSTSLSSTSPATLLALLDRILETTEWGTDDQKLGVILEECGISRAVYKTLCQSRDELERMRNDGTETIKELLTIKRKKSHEPEKRQRRSSFREPRYLGWSLPAVESRFHIPPERDVDVPLETDDGEILHIDETADETTPSPDVATGNGHGTPDATIVPPPDLQQDEAFPPIVFDTEHPERNIKHLFKCLEEPARFAIVRVLASKEEGAECSFAEISDYLAMRGIGQSQSDISHHLAMLLQTGILRSDSIGRNRTYRLKPLFYQLRESLFGAFAPYMAPSMAPSELPVPDTFIAMAHEAIKLSMRIIQAQSPSISSTPSSSFPPSHERA